VFALYLSMKLTIDLFFKDNPSKLFITIISTLLFFYSYPASFSFERGNSDLLALLFITLFMYAFKKDKKFASVIALTIATQLKIYPLFLIFVFFNKKDYKYFIYYGVINFILLFTAGLTPLKFFFLSLTSVGSEPYVWAGNHSLHSFLKLLGMSFNISDQLFKILYISIAVVLILVWIKSLAAINRHTRGFINFIINSLVIACLLTPVSHDYKLVILFPMLVVDLIYSYEYEKRGIMLLGIKFFAFASLLFSLNHGLFFYNTKFLPLIIIYMNINLCKMNYFNLSVPQDKYSSV